MNSQKNSSTSVRRLRIKIFWTIFGIFTVMIISLAALFTYQTYRREVLRVSEADLAMPRPDDSNPPANIAPEDTNPANRFTETRPPKFMETMRENHLSVLELLAIALVFELIAAWLSHFLSSHLVQPVAETFSTQKQFIADASHELKTPLAVVTVNADLLAEKLPTDRHLKNILSETTKMDQLVKQMLDLSATEEIAKYHFQTANLSTAIRDEVLVFEPIAYEMSLKIKTDLDLELTFDFDALKIQQLTGILLDNAIHHAKPRSTIEVGLKRSKRHIILTVRNRGLPIPTEDRERIFERFYRADSSRRRDQNHYGLGLAIAKNIASAHHGTITAHSAKGWTEFRVEF